ncbi:MAG: type III pantothenate kinase [Micropepsaceae bacterium]
MLLAIDAGNTNIVFAVHDGKEVRAQFRAVTKDNRTADEYYVWLTQLMQLEGILPHEITAAIISSVVPPSLFNLRRLCSKYFKQNAIVIGEPEVDLGIAINADRPRAVGADRLVNAVAGFKDYGGDLILIDFGTATTFDIVGTQGSYEGGIIAPGVNLSMEALHLAAAQLPRIAIERPQSVIGRDTIPAMQSGIFWGYIALVEGLVARIKAEYGKPMKVIGTGGLAHLFRHSTTAIEVVDHDLTIRGLRYIYERNASLAVKPVE